MEKKRKSKKIIVFVIALFLVLLLVLSTFFLMRSCDGNKLGNRDYREIKKEGVLRVLTNYSQIGYYVSDDTIAGFNHSIIEMLKDYSDLRIEVGLETSYSKAVDELMSGNCDILIYNTPITLSADSELGYTIPIIQNRQVLIQRNKKYNNGIEPLRSHLDLAGKTLHIPQGSPAILRIQNLSDEIGDTIYYKENELYGAEQLVMEVASGDIDYAVCDEYTAMKLSKAIPEIDYKTQIGFTHLEGWTVNKNSPVLLDSLNSWIGQIKKTTTYNDLYKKYYK